MLKLKEDGYCYISDIGIKYELLEGIKIGGKEKNTSDIIFIMLTNPDYNVDNNIVGYLFGAGMIESNLKGYEESIKKMVTEFEEKNFVTNNIPIIVYESEDIKQYGEDLKYWCNACGDLHHHGEYDIEEKDLPKELLRAYSVLWTEGNGSLCYLVEYKGEYKIALINEFDKDYAKDTCSTMAKLFDHMKSKAVDFSEMEEFKTAQIVITEEAGFLECHEFVVLLPCDTSKDLFDKIAAILYENMYK